MRLLLTATIALVVVQACAPTTTRADVLVATPATFAAIVGDAQPGASVKLLPGDYGDASLRERRFATPLTLFSADPDKPARFRSLAIVSSSGVTVKNVQIRLTPNAATQGHTPAVEVRTSDRIVLEGLDIKGAPAVTGISEDADPAAPRNTVNVVGRPTGRGVSILYSSQVTVEKSEISEHLHGIVVGASKDIVIRDNTLHHMRKSFILGTGERLTIDANYLHSPHPWKYGGAGDHGDFIALWNDPKQVGPSQDIRITRNLLAQGDGAPFIGMLIGGAQGFQDMKIDDNVLLMTGAQGIALMNVQGEVSRNLMMRTGGTAKDAPSILLRKGAVVTVQNNTLTDTYGTIATAAGPSVFIKNKTLGSGLTPQAKASEITSAWTQRVRAKND